MAASLAINPPAFTLPRIEFISVTQAAQILGCSHDTVVRRLESGELAGYRFGDRGWWRVSKTSVLTKLSQITHENNFNR